MAAAADLEQGDHGGHSNAEIGLSVRNTSPPDPAEGMASVQVSYSESSSKVLFSTMVVWILLCGYPLISGTHVMDGNTVVNPLLLYTML